MLNQTSIVNICQFDLGLTDREKEAQLRPIYSAIQSSSYMNEKAKLVI